MDKGKFDDDWTEMAAVFDGNSKELVNAYFNGDSFETDVTMSLPQYNRSTTFKVKGLGI